jgi:AraC-like DNA-binding protein
LRSFENGALPFYKNRHVPKNATLAAGEAVGYTDNSHFIKRFGEYCGMPPLQYKKAYGDKK